MAFWGSDGNVSHEDTKTCIRLLGQEVLPAVREIGKELGLDSPFEADAPVSINYTEGPVARRRRRRRPRAPPARSGWPPPSDGQGRQRQAGLTAGAPAERDGDQTVGLRIRELRGVPCALVSVMVMRSPGADRAGRPRHALREWGRPRSPANRVSLVSPF